MSNQVSSTRNDFASRLATDLRTVFRKLKQRMREQVGSDDLTPAQTSVVLRLERGGPATVSALARAEGMRPQSMSAVVAPLQEAGLVSGSADPTDGRQTLMALTPKCLKWIEEGRAARQDWLTTTIAHKLSASEQEDLQAAITLLARIVE